MQIVPLWQKFKQIGSLDKQVCELDATFKAIEKSITALRNQLAEQRASVEHAEQQHKKNSHAIALLEADITETLKKIAAKNKTLDDISNPKARLALEHEIATLEKECAVLEDRCLEVMSAGEIFTKFLTQAQSTLIPMLAEHESEITSLTQKKELLTVTMTEIVEQQKQVVDTITPEWLARYREMKTHVSDPIAPLVGPTCSACFYSVRPQDLVRLKNNAILPCLGCFRLLYCDSDQQK